MSDRCYIQANLRKKDAVLWEQALGDKLSTFSKTESKEDKGVWSIFDGEADYAWQEELNNIAAAGGVFTGFHAQGDNYPAEEFAGVNGRVCYWEVANDGEHLVPINRNSTVSPERLRAHRKYMQYFRQAVKQIEEKKHGVPTH